MRHEFTKKTQRLAKARSGGFCEAVGSLYGLREGERCNAPLDRGVEYDHYPSPATDPGSDTLDNCVACCPGCHRRKTSKYDVPMQAKGQRIRDKEAGIEGRKRPLHGGSSFRRLPSNSRDIWSDLSEGAAEDPNPPIPSRPMRSRAKHEASDA